MGRVLIVGASTRAAAGSAVRAGLQPVCADLFADLDTRQIAEIVPVHDYPASLPDDVADVRADGWFFTGGLENHPRLIEEIHRGQGLGGSLWGGPLKAVQRLRDPFWVAQTLKGAALPSLDVCSALAPPLADGSWMQKPVASAGGRAIRVWNKGAASQDFGETHYFQRRAVGEPMSAVFRRWDDRLEWIGATRQFINHLMSRASGPFSYSGSIGPIQLTESTRRAVTELADVLATESGVCGLFGLDFLLDGNDVHLLEVNPRYTASVEILELARQESVLRPSGKSKETAFRMCSSPPSVAKLVLYARKRFTTPDLSRFLRQDFSPWEVPYLADVPPQHSVIDAGWPICTVMADGNSLADCEIRLLQRAQTVWMWLDGSTCDPTERGSDQILLVTPLNGTHGFS